MALIGSCAHTVIKDHPTDTTVEKASIFNEEGEEIITYEFPVQVATTHFYDNVYLVITQIDNKNRMCSDCGKEGEIIWKKDFSYQFAVYESKEKRNANPNDFLFWKSYTLENYNHDIGLYEQIYNDIKTKNGLTNLIRD